MTIGVRVKFKNDDVVIRGMEGFGDLTGYVESVKHVFTRTGTDLRNICVEYYPIATDGEPKKRFYAATAMNSFYEYNEFAADDGINGIGDVDILLVPFSTAASAPMFDLMNGNIAQELGQALGVTSALDALTQTGIGTALLPVIGTTWAFAPDVIYGYANDIPSDRIKNTFYHEFAHASHFFAVPSLYWLDNIGYVIGNQISGNNPPYGNETDDGAGQTAIIEMWGFFYGDILSDRQYGLEHSFFNPNFTMEERRYINRLEGSQFIFDFIPQGLILDLVDDNTIDYPIGITETMGVIDNVSDYSISFIYNSLSQIKTDPDQMLPDCLSNVPPSTQPAAIVNLFDSY